MPDLFDSLKLGDLTLPSRILMAPLTRSPGTSVIRNADVPCNSQGL
jgi:2,4-dienoyl-CoA reductase-like NADH-dependent reductase (Old Yellow Enzyme family)